MAPKATLSVLVFKLWKYISQLPDIAQKCFYIRNEAMYQGVPKIKIVIQIKMRIGFCSIALAILIQQDFDYILLKTDIQRFVQNTETFISDIWKPRYKFPKFQFQNWWFNFLSQRQPINKVHTFNKFDPAH